MEHQKQRRTSQSGSWEPVEKWYRNAVGEEGHYYHQKIVIPGVLRLLALDPKKPSSILDVACGQGVLARHLPKEIDYVGLDIAPSLVKTAKSLDKNVHHRYVVADATKPFPLDKSNFTHAAIILAIQNMETPHLAFQNTAQHLLEGGRLVIVMNHPCFRVPRQSSWKVDDVQKVQYRRIDRYSSPLHVPIQAHPSQGEQSATTWSYHFSLASYSKWLFDAGFVIELIEEWHSDKESTGKAAKMENRSRQEIPMFLAIRARKNH
jgi:ubiquinone/menaquinone biosynthesis C-methylase UbiE